MSDERGFWRRDLARYGRAEWLTEPALWAQLVYRFGRWGLRAPAAIRPLAGAAYVAGRLLARIASGVDLPRGAVVGPGLRIFHGHVIVHPRATIGADCTIGHGVTIGIREEPDAFPRIGDRVVVSAYGQVLGGVTIGDDAKVGAMSVVLSDIPAACTAAGIPARVLGPRGPAPAA
ncbi:MAG: serine acetyltransferase [Actinomycetota bacterium]|nr:serine acetyltransferase [Actinomycetota bacterium]